jgi:hypothetical protein
MRRRRFGPSVLMLCAVLVAPLQSTAYAGVIGTELYLGAMDREQALDRIDAVLAREEVRARLEQLGVDPAQAIERVAALSDAELVALEQNLEELPAGGILGVIGVVFIVLLILEVVGVTNIFNKI